MTFRLLNVLKISIIIQINKSKYSYSTEVDCEILCQHLVLVFVHE